MRDSTVVGSVRAAVGRAWSGWLDGPMRLALGVGLVVGLVFVFVAPPWSGGADEAVHFARALDIAHGNLTPTPDGDRSISAIPASYRRDQDLVIANFFGPAPINGTMMSTLLHSTPDWHDTHDYDTRATTASTPVGYLPSAIAMMLPNTLGASGVVVMWFGRLADLFVYLLVVALALRLASAFRWVFAVAAIIPMNLALASAVTPDGLTISGIILVLAVFTRVWSRAMDRREADADERTIDRVDVAWVLGSGVLLALVKPPYFLIVALFLALALVFRRDRTVLAAAGASLVSLVVGAIAALTVIGSNYAGTAESISSPITVQPDVQKQRILDSPLRFGWRLVSNWFGHLNETVQQWSRSIGIWRSDPPTWLPWVLIVAFVVAIIILDRRDMLRFRGLVRAASAFGAIALIVAIYTTAYIWMDDTLEGRHLGDQIARYSLPLFPLAVMGWSPRWAIRLSVHLADRRSGGARLDADRTAHVALVVGLLAYVGVVAAAIIDWVSTGRFH